MGSESQVNLVGDVEVLEGGKKLQFRFAETLAPPGAAFLGSGVQIAKDLGGPFFFWGGTRSSFWSPLLKLHHITP